MTNLKGILSRLSLADRDLLRRLRFHPEFSWRFEKPRPESHIYGGVEVIARAVKSLTEKEG